MLHHLQKIVAVSLGACLFLLGAGQQTQAQEATPESLLCSETIQTLFSDLQSNCENLSAGQVCDREGEMTALEGIDTLSSSDETWDALALSLPANDPETNVQLILLGHAELSGLDASANAPAITATVRNASPFSANLRSGPSTDYEVAGTLGLGSETTADGRTADSGWLRLQTETGTAWIASSLVTSSDDLSALAIVDVNSPSATQSSLYFWNDAPLEGCDLASTGLLVHYASETPTQLLINDTALRLVNATLFLQASSAEALTINVLNGDVSITSAGETTEAEAGAQVSVALGGDAGLSATAAPVVGTYPFSLVAGLPNVSLMCIAGVGANVETVAYALPDVTTAGLLNLASDAHYQVEGQFTDDAGVEWYSISLGDLEGWTPASDLLTAGACADLPHLDAETVFATPEVLVSTGNAPAVGAFVPATQTIWMADTGVDVMEGTCTSSPIAQCSHLAATTLSGSTLSWRGQEPNPYPMALVGENTFAYNGRNHLGNANLSMYLTFTSESSWIMTMTYIYDNDPNCTHTFYYNAVLR